MKVQLVYLIFTLYFLLLTSPAKANFNLPSLSSFNITRRLEKYDLAFLQFTTSSCTLCLYLEKTLFEFKKEINRININFNKTMFVAKVNVETSPDLMERFGVYKFPSLFLLNNNFNTTYEFPLETSEATVSKLYNFVESHVSYEWEEIEAPHLLNSLKNAKFSVFYCGSLTSETEVLKSVVTRHAYLQKGNLKMGYLAKKANKRVVEEMNCPLQAEYNITSDKTSQESLLRFYIRNEDTLITYNGDISSEESLNAWIQANLITYVEELQSDNIVSSIRNNKLNIIFFYQPQKSSVLDTRTFQNYKNYYSIAKKLSFNPSFSFFESDIQSLIGKSFYQLFIPKPSELPLIAAFNSTNFEELENLDNLATERDYTLKYKCPTSKYHNLSDLEEYFTTLEQNNAEISLNSERYVSPTENEKMYNYKILISSNFASEIEANKDSDIFLFVKNPNDENNNKYYDMFFSLVVKSKKYDKLLFLQFDSSQNELKSLIPEINNAGFYFIPRNSGKDKMKTFSVYNSKSNVSIKGLTDFINTHSEVYGGKFEIELSDEDFRGVRNSNFRDLKAREILEQYKYLNQSIGLITQIEEKEEDNILDIPKETTSEENKEHEKESLKEFGEAPDVEDKSETSNSHHATFSLPHQNSQDEEYTYEEELVNPRTKSKAEEKKGEEVETKQSKRKSQQGEELEIHDENSDHGDIGQGQHKGKEDL